MQIVHLGTAFVLVLMSAFIFPHLLLLPTVMTTLNQKIEFQQHGIDFSALPQGEDSLMQPLYKNIILLIS